MPSNILVTTIRAWERLVCSRTFRQRRVSIYASIYQEDAALRLTHVHTHAHEGYYENQYILTANMNVTIR
jgi:hypothetical protein